MVDWASYSSTIRQKSYLFSHRIALAPSQNLNFTIYIWASLVAHMVKYLPAMQETRCRSLGWEDLLEKGMTTTPDSCPENSMDRGAWQGSQKNETTKWLTHTCIWVHSGFSVLPCSIMCPSLCQYHTVWWLYCSFIWKHITWWHWVGRQPRM